jgi:hypothetical protein
MMKIPRMKDEKKEGRAYMKRMKVRKDEPRLIKSPLQFE